MQQRIGEYRLLDFLGQGTFGDVYLARRQGEDGLVAVKILKTRWNDETLRDFLTEARMVFLQHPHILRVLDFGLEKEKPFLVMEHAPNGTLYQRHARGEQLPLALVCSYVFQLADALQYAHNRRIVHRDVKPQNMLLSVDNRVLLSDFGMAVAAHAEQSLRTSNMAGTIPYMAPEQIQGKPVPASDQFALGIIVYEWLCGRRPFRGSHWQIVNQQRTTPIPPLHEQAPNLPRAVSVVVMRALAMNPQDRFPSVQAFAYALAQAAHVEQQPAYRFVEDALPPAATIPLQQDELPAHGALPAVRILPRRYNFTLLRSISLATFKDRTEQNAQQSTTSDKQLSRHGSGPSIYDTVRDPSRSQSLVTPLHPNGDAFSVQTEPPRAQNSAVRKRLPLIRSVALLSLVILIVAGLLFSTHWLQQNQQRATSRSATHRLTSLQATSTAEARAYGNVVAQQGMAPGFDASNSNNNPYEQGLSTKTMRHVRLLWSYPLLPDDLGPVVANGLVYIGARNGELYVFDATCSANCQPLWTFQVGQGISPVAVGSSMLYVTSVNPFQRGSILYAFDAHCRSACQPLWSYTIAGSAANPIVTDGLVYVSSSQPAAGSTIQVFDERCRVQCHALWSYQIMESSSQGGPPPGGPPPQGGPPPPLISAPAVTADTIYVNSVHFNGSALIATISAFKAHCHSSCQPLWSYPPVAPPSQAFPPPPSSSPPLQLPPPFITVPTVAHGLVYTSLTQSDQATMGTTLYTFNASCRANCQPLWSSPGLYQVAVANGNVYVGDETQDTLSTYSGACTSHCHPLCSYQQIHASLPTNNLINSLFLPRIAHNLIYINLVNTAGSSNLYVFPADCTRQAKPVWTYGVNSEVTSAPTIVNSRIYIGVNNGMQVLGLDP